MTGSAITDDDSREYDAERKAPFDRSHGGPPNTATRLAYARTGASDRSAFHGLAIVAPQWSSMLAGSPLAGEIGGLFGLRRLHRVQFLAKREVGPLGEVLDVVAEE